MLYVASKINISANRLTLVKSLNRGKAVFVQIPVSKIIREREEKEKEKIRYAILLQIQTELLAMRKKFLVL